MRKSRRKNFFQRFWDAFWRPEMLVLPGQISFFLFLSIVPTITLIGYVATYLNLSNNLVQNLIGNALTKDMASLLTPILTSAKVSPAFFISLGVGYFIASNGMSSIIVASNTVYGIKDSGFFNRRLKAIVMEVILVILFLFVLIVPLLGNFIIEFLHYFNLNANTTEIVVNILSFLKSPFAWVIIFIFIKMIYTMAPDKKIPSRNVNGGALFTTIGWVGITEIYSYYIQNYANYSIFYGSLANIVVLMMWVYFLSYVFVMGIAMNYHEELEKTGVIEVKKIIEESANSAPIMPEKESSKKRKRKNKKEKNQEEVQEEVQNEEKKEIEQIEEKAEKEEKQDKK